MKKTETSRRDFMKISIAGATVGTLGILGGRTGQAVETGKHQIKIAGYDYDRVRAIMDGQVGIESAEVSFNVESIYEASRYAFGPDRKYEIFGPIPSSLCLSRVSSGIAMFLCMPTQGLVRLRTYAANG